MSETSTQRRGPKGQKMLIAPLGRIKKSKYTTCPRILPPSPHGGSPSIYPSLQALYPCPEAFDDVTYMAHFVKLGLEVVDLAQDVSKAGDFSVGGGNGGLGAR